MDNYEIKKAELKIQVLSSVAGAKGEEGENMYEIAKKNGFEGTEQEFIAQYMNVDARIGYYECDTDSSTAAKTCQGASFILPSIPPYGGSFKVKFLHKNSAANPTLSINQSTPKPLYYNGAIASSTNTWEDGDVLDLYYDGINFNARSVVEKFATGEKVKNVSIDDEPTAGSDNLVKSGGCEKKINRINERTSEISKETTEDENSDSIQFVDNNEVIHEITKDYADFTNLKNNGKDVLTKDNLETLATKEEVENKQDKIDGLSEDNNAEDEVEEFVGVDENNSPCFSFGRFGVKAKAFLNLDGSSVFSSSLCYVSPNGNDANSGYDTSHPLKTINKALESGFCDIILLGGVYNQSINLTLCDADKVSIKGARGESVIFKKADSLIADDGSESLVSGYTRVYKLENVAAISYGETGAKWLFFDDVDDENTAITPQDAHPLEKGKFYRCDCTKSVITTADTVSSACDEIEACDANEYKWFYNNGTLYFNRPAATSVNALYKSVGNFFTVRSEQSLVLSNIEFRYGNVNLVDLNIVKVYNCAAKYVYGGGAFSYDKTISIEFVNCEASSCFRGNNGDGFNASGYATSISSKRTQAWFVDCWSHDNNDDGFSDHEWCESTVIGGLYEWNKKAGVTPSYGSHCSCHNVCSRHNYSGFLYVGAVNDSGNKGQVVCYNCVSDSNGRGGYKVGFGIYGENNYNRMLLYNCLAIGEYIGYGCDSYNYLDLYDCRTLNCTSQESGDANVYNSIEISN